jgi:hypothetical protein
MSEDTTPTTEENQIDPKQLEMRNAVRFFYDLQKLRIQSGLRAGAATADLSIEHHRAMHVQSFLMEQLEGGAKKEVTRLLKGFPIYTEWLKAQKGIGPTLSGVLIAEIDIHRSETPSQLWSFCGLGVGTDGKAQRRKKGEKANFNPWLKSKVVHVLGDCMIKAKSPWRDFYDNSKTRKQNTIVDVCMACNDTGKVEKTKCRNCDGGEKRPPWGRSDAHRHRAAMRYMVKMFLLELYKQWRTLENLPVSEPYSEAVLGRRHGDHGGTNVQAPRNQRALH